MMCKYPIVRKSDITQTQAALNYHARDLAMPIGCGQCLHCRINKARVWTHRILLEQRTACDSAFITLTYDDDHVPKYGNLMKSDLQNYIKNIRRVHEPGKYRYYAIGEYGEEFGRPHYHMALFSDIDIDRQSLDTKWQNGFTMVGDLSQESARYMTKYLTDKMHPDFQLLYQGLTPEFRTSSKDNGGLGIGAIRQIAERIKNNKILDGQIIDAVGRPGKQSPLGRYLTRKLAEELGLSEESFQRRLLKFQNEGFEKRGLGKKDYLLNLTEEDVGKKESQRKKHKIFNARKKL